MITIKVKQGTPRKMDITDKPDFNTWLKRVDNVLIRCVGLSTSDLPDCLYMDMYESRLRPIYAAKKALKNAGDY